MKTRGVLIRSESRRIDYGDIELPPTGAEDVVVTPRAVGICRSDLELADGHLDQEHRIAYPLVFGHEWSGTVVESARNADAWKPGDRVVGAGDLGQREWFGITRHGAASQRFTVPSRLLFRLPDEMSFRQGALVEPFACAYRGLIESGGTDGSQIVAVVGAGIIGQCALGAARAMGAVTVVVEPSESRRQAALDMGAHLALDPVASDDLADELRELTGGRQADLVLEASGAPPALVSTFSLAEFGGRITFMGICAAPVIDVPLRLVQSKDLVLRGVTGAPTRIWQPTLRFLRRHDIDLSPLVSRTFPFEAASEAFATARDTSASIKVHLESDAADDKAPD